MMKNPNPAEVLESKEKLPKELLEIVAGGYEDDECPWCGAPLKFGKEPNRYGEWTYWVKCTGATCHYTYFWLDE